MNVFAIIAAASLGASCTGECGVVRVFREEPPVRGNVNVVRSQPVDEASWLWMPGDAGDGAEATFLVFRKAFEVNAGDKPLTIDVSADERFYLTCDGKFVARGPDRCAVDDWQYQSYRLTLAPGRHELRALVWRVGERAPIAQLSWRGGFVLKADGAYDARLTTGKAQWEVGALEGIRSIGADSCSWKWGLGDQWEIVGSGPYSSEPERWTKAEVVRGPAGAAKLPTYGGETSGWRLFPSKLPDQSEIRSTPGEFRAATHRAGWRMTNVYTQADAEAAELPALNALLKEGRPFAVPPKTRLQAAWDLGRYTCAYPELVLGGGKGARVALGWAESARQPVDRRKGDRNAIVGKYLEGYGETFVSDGRERAVFSTPWFRCGRWCRLDVETGDEPLTIASLSLLETHYPIDVHGDFSAPQDPSLADIRRICIRAQEMCAHDMLYDCPYYEQQMYPGDARVQMNVLSAMSSDDRLVRRSIELFDLARNRDGTVPMNWPTRGRQSSGSYTLCYLCMYGDYVMNHADRSWLRSRLAGFRSTMLGMEAYEDGDGLLDALPGWQFVDWSTEWGWHGLAPGCADGKGPNATINLFWLHAMQAAARVERAVGSAELAAYWDGKTRRLFDSILRRFWSEEKGLIADTPDKTSFSEHQQCLAILSDMTPADKAERIKAALFGEVPMSRTTVYFSYYLFETYFKYGRADLFLKRLDLWRGYLAKGVTALLEEPETIQKDSRSDCHAWGAHPIWFMATGIAGIRSDAPFFERVRIAPCPGSLKDIRAVYPHPSGKDIRVDLHFAEGGAEGTVETPVAGSFVWNGTATPLVPGVNRVGFFD